MSSKSRLDASIHAFAGELRSFVQRASDSITALKRTVEQRPQAGVQDFKECLEDLEQQVADYTDEIQQLARCTADTVSFEELIGHCSAVYDANRSAVLALEQHLAQYGYQRPAGTVLEPESLADCLQDDGDCLGCADFGGSLSSLEGYAVRQRMFSSAPGSPVSKGTALRPSVATAAAAAAAASLGQSRLGLSQPGSPVTAHQAAAAGLQASGMPPGTIGRPTAALSQLAPAPQQQGGQQQLHLQQQQQQQRVSLGSNTSSTPAGLFISPGVAALANKYATSSIGGSSVGALSLPDQGSEGPPSSSANPMRSACRDLTLSYAAMADPTSPDMPIFGRTAAPLAGAPPGTAAPAAAAGAGGGAQGRGQQQQQAGVPPLERRPLAPRQGTPPTSPARLGATAGAGAGASTADGDADSTGELYSSLIHSSFGPRGREGRRGRAAAGGGSASTAAALGCDGGDADDEEPVTPPCGARGGPGGSPSSSSSPQAPATAGRLPPTWVQSKMQELEDLQANVTLTLSQMKRCPSRSRTASASPDEDDGVGRPGDADGGGGACAGRRPPSPMVPPQQLQQQQQQQRWAQELDGTQQRQQDQQQQQPRPAATPYSAYPRGSALGVAATACKAAPVAADSAADTAATQQRKAPATGGKPLLATDRLAAAAAAASADLENLMASLSMKYAAEPPAAAAAGADAGAADGGAVVAAAAASAVSGVPCDPTVHSSTALAALSRHYGAAGTPGDAGSSGSGAACAGATAALAGQPCASPASQCTPTSQCSPTILVPVPAAVSTTAAAARHDSDRLQSQQQFGEGHRGVGGSGLQTPATQQPMQRVEERGLDTNTGRAQASIRAPQPTTELKRLQDMRGPNQPQAITQVAQHLDNAAAASGRDVAAASAASDAAACPPAAAAAAAANYARSGSSGAQPPMGGTRGATPAAAATAAERGPAVLQPLQVQPTHTPAATAESMSLRQRQPLLPGDENLSAGAGRGGLSSAHKHAPEQQQQPQQVVEEGQAEGGLTPRAARMQRRLQLKQQIEQRQQERAAAGSSVVGVAAGGQPGGAAAPAGAAAGPVKVAPVSTAEYETLLPAWCRSLMTVELLNGVLTELTAAQEAAGGRDGFTAEDVEGLGHSSSKSKTIVSCLHKLNRATLQRSAAGVNCYKLLGSTSGTLQ